MNTLYEITFIVDESSTNEAVKSAVIATGANVVSETEVGVRRFIYPIAKKTSGKYFAIEFNADAEMLVKLEKQLKTDKGLIRYLIIKALRKPLVLKRENRDANGVEIIKTPETAKNAEPVKTEKVIEPIVKPEEVTLEEVIENKPEELDKVEIAEETQAEEEAGAETKQENKEEPARNAFSSADAGGGIRNQEEKVVEKPKKQAPKKKPVKAEKVSAEELDSKLAELVSED